MSVFANKLNTGYLHKPGYSTTKRAHRREDTVRNTTWAGPTLTALHHYTGRPCTGNGMACRLPRSSVSMRRPQYLGVEVRMSGLYSNIRASAVRIWLTIVPRNLLVVLRLRNFAGRKLGTTSVHRSAQTPSSRSWQLEDELQQFLFAKPSLCDFNPSSLATNLPQTQQGGPMKLILWLWLLTKGERLSNHVQS